MTAALPALTASLALEIAPVRVNLIAAGFVDTPLSASLLGDRLEERRDELRATLPIGRVVGPADVAALAVHLMTNTALTGATYDIDGGQQLGCARMKGAAMRSDIVPGGTFPDYELPDHDSVPRRLSEIQGDDPLILTLARGHYCPKEHQQHLELAAFYPKIAVAYTQVATIATDEHHTLRSSAPRSARSGRSSPTRGASSRRTSTSRSTPTPSNDPMIPHTLVLKPGLVVHSIYNGYWFWGRPSVVDLWHDLRDGHARDPPRLGPQHARAARAWDAGDPRPSTAGTGARALSGGGSRVVVDRGPRRACRSDPGRRRRPRPAAAARVRAPPHDVVLQRARAAVVDEGAVLQRDAAAVREEQLVEGAQTVRAAVDVLAARRLAHVAVGLERRDDRVDVAGRERALVLAHDVRRRRSGSGWSSGGRFAWRPVSGQVLK